jgi:hypothetical protein
VTVASSGVAPFPLSDRSDQNVMLSLIIAISSMTAMAMTASAVASMFTSVR